MAISVGITIGSISEPSGICVAESQNRSVTAGWTYDVEHYLIRKLERLPSGTSYPEIADRAAALVTRLSEYTDDSIRIAVDVTGKGKPIVDVFEERIRDYLITQVYFNYGDQMTTTEYGTVISLGKAFLVTRLVTALQDHRLHLPREPASEILATELENYQIEIDPDANNRYGGLQSRQSRRVGHGARIGFDTVSSATDDRMTGLLPARTAAPESLCRPLWVWLSGRRTETVRSAMPKSRSARPGPIESSIPNPNSKLTS